ncbi:MAG: hypothetical protein WAN57_01520 [Smithella sp.]
MFGAVFPPEAVVCTSFLAALLEALVVTSGVWTAGVWAARGITCGITGACCGLTRGSGLGWRTVAGRLVWTLGGTAGTGRSINWASMGGGSTDQWEGFSIKNANPHNAIVQTSRAVGSVQGRRRQGLSIIRSVLIEVVSLNMFDCYKKMLCARIAGLNHRLDGNTVGRRTVGRQNDARVQILKHRFQSRRKRFQSYRDLVQEDVTVLSDRNCHRGLGLHGCSVPLGKIDRQRMQVLHGQRSKHERDKQKEHHIDHRNDLYAAAPVLT